MWDGLGGGDGDVMQGLVDAFNGYYTGKINVLRTMQGTWADLLSKTAAATKAGTGLPDIVLCRGDDRGLFADHPFMPIDDLVKAAGFSKAQYVPDAWDGQFLNGKQYALPWDIHPYSLYANLGMANQYGITVPAAGELKTPDDLIKWCETARGKLPSNLYPYLLPYGGWNDGFTFYMVCKGNLFTKPDLMTPDFRINTPDGIAAFKFYETMVKENLAKPHAWAEMAASLGGDCLSNLNGTWMQATFDQIKGFQYTVVPLFGPDWAWSQTHSIYLTRVNGDIRTNAAWEFVKWMDTATNNGTWGARAGHIPALLAAQDYPDYKNNPMRQLWKKQAQLGFKQLPIHPDEWKWLESICAATAVKVIDGKETAEQAAADAQKQLDDLLATY
jgi:multiple sugar transport system substrate-binding protein